MVNLFEIGMRQRNLNTQSSLFIYVSISSFSILIVALLLSTPNTNFLFGLSFELRCVYITTLPCSMHELRNICLFVHSFECEYIK